MTTGANGETVLQAGDPIPPQPFEVDCLAGSQQCQKDTILVYAGEAGTQPAVPPTFPACHSPPVGRLELNDWYAMCAGTATTVRITFPPAAGSVNPAGLFQWHWWGSIHALSAAHCMRLQLSMPSDLPQQPDSARSRLSQPSPRA